MSMKNLTNSLLLSSEIFGNSIYTVYMGRIHYPNHNCQMTFDQISFQRII